MLLKPGTRDRGGASTTEDLLNLTRRLKEIHTYHYVAQDITWRLWANEILSSESCLQEEMIQGPPPAKMIHLFARAPANAEQQLGSLRQNLSVAQTINSAKSTELESVKTVVVAIKARVQQLAETVNDLIKDIEDLELRVEAMENTAATAEGLLSSMQSAVGCEETDYGRSLLATVQDQLDVDHS